MSNREAVAQIGVTPASFERHLSGSYVRSDSLARYRAWLGKESPLPRPSLLPATPQEPPRHPVGAPAVELDLPEPLAPVRPYSVVDLFSGCGGISLGFELFGTRPNEGPPPAAVSQVEQPHGPRARFFETVLALDIEDKAVRLQNENHPPSERLAQPPARWVDLSLFENAAEILAFYLDHYATCRGDSALRRELDRLNPVPLRDFQALARRLDAWFLARLQEVRGTRAFRDAYAQMAATAPGQTSVIGFHHALGLPETSAGRPALGPLPWVSRERETTSGSSPPSVELAGYERTRDEATAELTAVWDAEVAGLRARTEGKGRGQLASSAGRIGEFLTFLGSEPAEQIRAAWIDWRARRDGLRRALFTGPVEAALRSLYTGERRVDVLLGGPPCQGFSRIGRGKIRSLRDDRVHVQTDAGAGDTRNLLLLKYVEFISALEPRVFLFENVRHFQARVQTPEGTFLATDILREAIHDLSQQRLSYRIADRIVDCSRHLVPQTRERFVMIGVRGTVAAEGVDPERLAGWCLRLADRNPVPLRAALDGLPAPLLARGPRAGSEGGLAGLVSTHATGERNDETGEFRQWIGQLPPRGLTRPANATDGHYVRDSRADDRAFFELLGPGCRWMDYRCDTSATVAQLRTVLERVRDSLPKHSPAAPSADGVDTATIDALLARLDGSLSLRLLLESIPLPDGEVSHHLLAANYLGKKDGNNGDWIARLHPDRPSKTIVSHMAKDTYAYIHPTEPRTLSVREAARLQTFPDWFRFGKLGLVDAFRAVGNAVPPLLSYQFAGKVARLLAADDARTSQAAPGAGTTGRRKKRDAARLNKVS